VRSSCDAISRKVTSGPAMSIRATGVIKRSSGGARPVIDSGAATHEPVHRAAQPLEGPALALMVKRADDVAPAVLRPHPLDLGQPGRSVGDEIAEIDLVSRCGNRSDRAAPVLAQPWIAGKHAARLGRLDAGLVRSEISARSSWSTAPSNCSENIPCGVEVSIGSRGERKCGRASPA
jgi:hypothetical protein